MKIDNKSREILDRIYSKLKDGNEVVFRKSEVDSSPIINWLCDNDLCRRFPWINAPEEHDYRKGLSVDYLIQFDFNKKKFVRFYEELTPEVPKDANNIHKITYDTKGILSVDEVEIKLQSQSKQSELCKILFESKESEQKEWDREEILEIWLGPKSKDLYLSNGRMKDEFKLQVYSAARGINNKVLNAARIGDLLIFDTRIVAINSKYLISD